MAEAHVSEAPVAEREEKVQELKFSDGAEVSWKDDYFYLRNKEDPKTIPYIEAENAFCDAKLKHLEGSRKEVYDEMLARVVEDDTGPLVKYGDYEYYYRTEQGKPYNIYCRKAKDGEEQIVLNCNELAEKSEFFKLGSYKLSPDASVVCYGVDFEGNERYELRFRNCDTKEDFGPKIQNSSGSVTFDNIGNVYFSRYNDAWRPDKVFRKSYKNEDEPKVNVMEEKNKRFRLGAQR